MLLVGGGVSTRELAGLGGGVSTCIRSPRPNTRETADASVAGRAGGTLLASAMAALDALGGSCGCSTLGGISDDIASARLDGRETADVPRAGGGLGILFANGTAVGGIAVGPMVGKDLDAPGVLLGEGGFGALLTAGMGRGAAGAAGEASVTCPCLGALRCGRGGTFGGGGGAFNGATFGNSSSTATTLCASEMLDCVSEMSSNSTHQALWIQRTTCQGQITWCVSCVKNAGRLRKQLCHLKLWRVEIAPNQPCCAIGCEALQPLQTTLCGLVRPLVHL